jgi:hypothetical protein
MQANIINLIPKEINVNINGKIRTIPPSGRMIKANIINNIDGVIDGIPVYKATVKKLHTFEYKVTPDGKAQAISETIQDMPEPTPGTYYIVGFNTASSTRRPDFLIPGQTVFENGKKAGCDGLSKI